MQGKKKLGVKSIIFLVVIILVVLLAISGLTTVFILNYNTFAPDRPIILEDGQNIYISTTINDSYEGYRFRVKSNEKQIIFDSKTNIISAKKLIEKGCVIGKTYSIASCYLGSKNGNNSEYSDEIEWVCSDYLQTPQISINRDLNQIEWQAIDFADYYRVFYNGDQDYIETEDNFISLDSILGGERTITVSAYSNMKGYKPSSSNIIEEKIIHVLKGFDNISFDVETKVITASSQENYQKIYVYLGLGANEPQRYEVSVTSILLDNIYTYKINIESIYNNENRIGILPMDIDEYNISGNNIKYYQM